jgi:L-cysteine:1D-myo-inositol 2-amino-2-deoxy-alpha-D-glucopyranoside ligase
MRQLRIYNSLTRNKQIFRPAHTRVGMYVCGITPYGVTHLGHAFTYTFFDVLARYLRYLGYDVTYTQNVTDIDDDIMRVAKTQQKNWRQLGEKHTRQFLEDMQWLGNKPSSLYTRASDHIPEIQAIIANLLQKKFAYERQGSVYFEIAKDTQYGKLSRLSKNNMLTIANQRGNNPDDPNKRNPLDFVLWQAAKPKEPSWNSPWGKGRPGWHIECSAMSTKYLGQPFVIHGGGGDLIFPHHESEIAQSENANGTPMAHYWMHTGMLRYKKEKMSKSLGNLILIENLKKTYNANTVRLALLSHHYRAVWEYTEQDMQKARELNTTLQRIWRLPSKQGSTLRVTKEHSAFFAAMDNDMDTPAALAALEKTAKNIAKSKIQNTADAKAFCMRAFSLLGLTLEFEQT